MTWEELSTHDLLVYSTTWCSDCRRLKQVLDRCRVRYREVDIDSTPAAAEKLRAATGRAAIPYVQINGGAMVRGWHEEKPGKFDEALFLQECEEALSRARETPSK